MSLKEAAEELLRVADEIEAEAEQVTDFVCDTCNHTATLAKINQKRVQAAEQAGEDVTVSKVTVNDQVACPACDEGTMAYHASEASERFYINPDKEAAEEEEEEKEEEGDKSASEPVDYDSLERYQNA